jgi:hypothetical protein
MSYTLVYSCKPKGIAYEPLPVTKLFNAILKEKFTRLRSTRITMKNNNYVYHPTGEYQNYILRFKGIKK